MPKRRAPRKSSKDAVRKRQGNRCGCRTGECGRPELPPDGKGLVQYQHEPPLANREIEPDDSDWIPSQHSPYHLYAELTACHHRETYHPRSKATSLGSDRHNIDQVRRLRGEVKKKRSAKIPARPMQGGKSQWPKGQKIPRRPFPKRR